MAKKKIGRRGGRKPGQWTLLTSDSLKAFRKDSKLSRVRLSELLGVSSTSIQNWETGRSVPLTRYQQQIVDLMKGGAPAPASPARPAPMGRARSPSPGDSPAGLLATSEIMKGFLATPQGNKLAAGELVTLTMSIRAALS